MGLGSLKITDQLGFSALMPAIYDTGLAILACSRTQTPGVFGYVIQDNLSSFDDAVAALESNSSWGQYFRYARQFMYRVNPYSTEAARTYSAKFFNSIETFEAARGTQLYVASSGIPLASRWTQNPGRGGWSYNSDYGVSPLPQASWAFDIDYSHSYIEERGVITIPIFKSNGGATGELPIMPGDIEGLTFTRPRWGYLVLMVGHSSATTPRNYYCSYFLYYSDLGSSVAFANQVKNAILDYNSNIQADESESSIYGPGGDTTNPHNPYPGGSSGSNPGTNDPLNSGTDTTSTSTPGTWELPFDEVPDTPATVHSVDLGLYNVYALSAAQVKELANYLFSGITELGENLVKLIWGSKRDVIISLYEFPLMITNQGTDTIRFIFDTDLAGLFHGKQLTSEYIPIDFGTIQVDRYSGTFYDFEPYTTLTLYIPYIGYIDLKPTEVVGSTLSIRGYVHLTTGELNVNVRSSRTGILGSYSGAIGRMLPIADADATDIYASIIKTAASLGAVALAGAGMAAASSVAAGISTPNKQTVDSARDTYMQSVGAWGSATRGVRGLEASMLQAQGSYEKAQAGYAEQAGKYNAAQSAVRANREDFHDSASDAISNSLNAVTTGFGVSRGTVMTSSNGRVSPQRCFLRIEVPHQNVSRQQKILGYPANTSDALNSDRLHGYTELRTIELSIPNATLTEIQELEDILRGGFYLP